MTALPPHIRAHALTFVLSMMTSFILAIHSKHPYNVGNHVRFLKATLISPFT